MQVKNFPKTRIVYETSTHIGEIRFLSPEQIKESKPIDTMELCLIMHQDEPSAN